MAGEARYRLGPLALPDPDDLAARPGRRRWRCSRTGPAGPMRISRWTSRPGRRWRRLVARLDGMPLAIELAAARVEALGVSALLDRLDDRFALLTSGDRLAPDRQRSLAATVEWSYQLLDEHERRVFRAVSVFPGRSRWRGRGGRRGGGRAGGAAAGGLLAAGPAAGRAGWPVAVSDAGDAARLRGRAAGRGRGAGRGRRRAGRVRAAGGGGGRGGAADQRAGRWPRPGGWMPRTPPCARCWPGPWAATWTWRCGWRSRWAGGGCCAAGARPVPAAARGGRARRAGQRRVVRRADAGSAWRRCSRPICPGRWATSPRSATPCGTGGRPGLLAEALAGRSTALLNTGPARRGGRGWPPRAGHGPRARLPGRRGAGPGGASAIAAFYSGDYDGAVAAGPAGRSRSPAGVPGGWPGRAATCWPGR